MAVPSKVSLLLLACAAHYDCLSLVLVEACRLQHLQAACMHAADVHVLCLTQLPVICLFKCLVACWGASQRQAQMGKPQPASNYNTRMGCLDMVPHALEAVAGPLCVACQ